MQLGQQSARQQDKEELQRIELCDYVSVCVSAYAFVITNWILYLFILFYDIIISYCFV